MALTITTVLAGLMGFLLLVLGARVVAARRAGSGDDTSEKIVARRMRGQANFVEYVPLALILFALLEYQGANSLFLAALAILFAFARIVHGYAFAFSDHWPFGRYYGTLITFIIVAILSCSAMVVTVMDLLG